MVAELLHRFLLRLRWLGNQGGVSKILEAVFHRDDRKSVSITPGRIDMKGLSASELKAIAPDLKELVREMRSSLHESSLHQLPVTDRPRTLPD